jgi:hypothetical protein
MLNNRIKIIIVVPDTFGYECIKESRELFKVIMAKTFQNKW